MKWPKSAHTTVHGVLQSIKERTGQSYIIAVCIRCDEVRGIKDGKGVTGISYGFCPDCAVLYRAENMLTITEPEGGKGENKCKKL
jgi:hypothetical protein